MYYKTPIDRKNPSCLVFLIDQSGSMSDPIGGTTSGKTKAQGVADAINRFLNNLVIKCSKPEVRHYFDVAVIGYGATVGPALGGPLAGRQLVTPSDIGDNPLRVEDRQQTAEDGMGGLVKQQARFPVWFDPVANGGTPMCQAFTLVLQMLTDWVANHPASYPPVVINITDGEPTDGDPGPIARQVQALATIDGAVLVFNCHISTSAGEQILFPNSEAGLPDEQARRLFQMSSELPAKMRAAAEADHMNVAAGARGFAFQADLVELIKFLDIGTQMVNQNLR
jgi:hypothetical protein